MRMYGRTGHVEDVVCTNKPETGYPYITVGKRYSVLDTSYVMSTDYLITDDEGDFVWYNSKFFE